jgi:hypothetical protein
MGGLRTTRATMRGLIWGAVRGLVFGTATVGAYLFAFTVGTDVAVGLAVVASDRFMYVFQHRDDVSLDRDFFAE